MFIHERLFHQRAYSSDPEPEFHSRGGELGIYIETMGVYGWAHARYPRALFAVCTSRRAMQGGIKEGLFGF